MLIAEGKYPVALIFVVLIPRKQKQNSAVSVEFFGNLMLASRLFHQLPPVSYDT